MVVKKQDGFTLVEVILVMAISAGLLLIIFKGFSVTRARSEFQGSIEKAVQQMLEARSEANDDVSAIATGNTDTTVNFGVLVTFTDGSSTFTKQTLTTANASPTDGQVVTIDASSLVKGTLDWGSTFSAGGGPSTHYIAFTRSLVDGSLRTTSFTSLPATLTYGDFTPGGVVDTIKIVDEGNTEAALLNIDESNNSVTRTFL